MSNKDTFFRSLVSLAKATLFCEGGGRTSPGLAELKLERLDSNALRRLLRKAQGESGVCDVSPTSADGLRDDAARDDGFSSASVRPVSLTSEMTRPTCPSADGEERPVVLDGEVRPGCPR
mmetsp:Transcript_8420/g.18726  ORF Transcript_8420/g.18726 Transcript_8420/m.18726 type:complete len:120 (-) Transcript_8420:489-848(-)